MTTIKKMARPVIIFLLLITLLADFTSAVRLIRENGFRQGSHYYHMGDGSHAYHFNTETTTSIYFKCVFAGKLDCHGRAIFRLGGNFRHSNPHNHPPDREFVGQRHFRENVLQRCGEARYVAFKDILDEARRDGRYARNVRAVMTMRRLRNSMYARRMKSYPQPGPQSLLELTHLLNQQRYKGISSTVDGMDNLYAGSITAIDNTHHVLFMSRRMRQFAQKVSIIQSDGTFRARPNIPPSSQVFVLVTTWRNSVVPLGWVLMERRTLAAYRSVIHLLKQVCPDLNPDVIITDWEYAQQRAWQDAFPEADVQGCLWHLCRAFIKKARKLGLFPYRRHVPDLMDLIKRSCAISLLPVRYFLVGLGLLRREAQDVSNLAAFLLIPFFNYVEEKWINNINRRHWMSFYNSAHRTNNCCESHNKMLRKEVGAYRPNVYAFIAALSRLEHNAALDAEINLPLGNYSNRTRRWRSVCADRQLKALCKDLKNNVFLDRNYAVKIFLDRASNLFATAYNDLVRREAGEARVRREGQ